MSEPTRIEQLGQAAQVARAEYYAGLEKMRRNELSEKQVRVLYRKWMDAKKALREAATGAGR